MSGRKSMELQNGLPASKWALYFRIDSLAGGDSIDGAAREVAPHLAHVHLRDARAIEGREHWVPVLAGRGAVSFAAVVNALRKLNYEDYISFEWEKYWHPEIEEPEVALPDFIKAMKAILQRDQTANAEEGSTTLR